MPTAYERQQQFAEADAAHQRLRHLIENFRAPLAAPAPVRAKLRQAGQAPSAPAGPEPRPFARALLRDVPPWQFAVRHAAQVLARQQAETAHEHALAQHQARLREHRAAQRRQEAEQRIEQRLLDTAFGMLEGGSPRHVRVALTDALERYKWPAQVVRVEKSFAAVRITVPAVDVVVPDREPSVTPGGKPTTRKLPQGERNDLYAEVVASAALGAARLALVSAPSLQRAGTAAFSDDQSRTNPIAWCSLRREALRAAEASDDALLAFYDADGLMEAAGRTRELRPLDPGSDPQLRRFMSLLG